MRGLWVKRTAIVFFMVAQLPIVKDSQIQASLERAMQHAIREEEALSQIVKRLHTLEVTGGPDALFSLSILNEMGSCVEADPVKARSLLTRAAELGNAEAQTYLGLKQTDCKQALYWWEKAALQGDASALKALARTYHNWLSDSRKGFSTCADVVDCM
jgi:hypothetical protein